MIPAKQQIEIEKKNAFDNILAFIEIWKSLLSKYNSICTGIKISIIPTIVPTFELICIFNLFKIESKKYSINNIPISIL